MKQFAIVVALVGVAVFGQPITSDSKPVLTVFTASMNNRSVEFVVNQVKPLSNFSAQNILNQVKLDIIPYGYAKEIATPDGYTYLCVKGPKECLLDKAILCGAVYFNYQEFVDFTVCIEDNAFSNDDIIKKCASSEGADYIAECAGGQEGNKLMHAAGNTQHRMAPLIEVPHIMLDGKYNATVQEMAETDLLKLLESIV